MEDADDLVPRTAAPPQQQPAPRYPSQKAPQRQDTLRARRLDADFLNPQRMLHFAHLVDTVDDDRGTPSTTQKLSTIRLESEMHRLANHVPSLDTLELESVDRQDIMRKMPLPNPSSRYDSSQLVDVDAPTPVKPRQVKKQVTEAWKAAHAVAPSINLNPDVRYDLEGCIPTSSLDIDDPFFNWEPPKPAISRNPPRYLNESVVHFSSR